MRLTIWLHEARRAGPAALLAPPAALLLTAAIAMFIQLSGAGHERAERLLLAGLEAVAPLSVAMVALTIVVRETCRELHLSLPTLHLATIGRRLGVLGASTAACCLIYAAGAWLAGYRLGPGGAATLLVWAAPALWLAAFAALVAAVTRSAVLTSSLVALIWLAEQIWATVFVTPALRPLFLFFTSRVGDGPGWAANRIGLLAGGLVLLAATAAVLHRPERLLTEEDA
ncbi:hypothetical protein [Asanoa iriomotensis]|uniref:ABC-2 type transport system permease protein n=1 Tax=Asanoa iriomotensis TaxID=234613 RepID=A0ABQ4CC10_9ACTN|nr:hypothetical protein [Asanoa iriomotensis]GIF59996.1 hypothetical protein Air01nite_60910 [Asanoa iriomotensis]